MHTKQGRVTIRLCKTAIASFLRTRHAMNFAQQTAESDEQLKSSRIVSRQPAAARIAAPEASLKVFARGGP